MYIYFCVCMCMNERKSVCCIHLMNKYIISKWNFLVFLIQMLCFYLLRNWAFYAWLFGGGGGREHFITRILHVFVNIKEVHFDCYEKPDKLLLFPTMTLSDFLLFFFLFSVICRQTAYAVAYFFYCFFFAFIQTKMNHST